MYGIQLDFPAEIPKYRERLKIKGVSGAKTQ